jgi:hypothetical protein
MKCSDLKFARVMSDGSAEPAPEIMAVEENRTLGVDGTSPVSPAGYLEENESALFAARELGGGGTETLETVCAEPVQKIMVEGPTADPAANKTDDGRTLPVAKCQCVPGCLHSRRRRWFVKVEEELRTMDYFFTTEDNDYVLNSDFRLHQIGGENLCDLDGYGEEFRGNPLGYFDSGSTSHLCPHLELFNDCTKFQSSIVLPNGTKMIVLGIGKVGALADVLYVPDLERVIISTGKLDSAGYKIIMFKGMLEAYDEADGLAFTGTLVNGMYHLDLVEKMIERFNAINI